MRTPSRIIHNERVYLIQRTPQGVTCTVDGEPISPRLDLWNHSPTGFEFGYLGSGPAQLALAILADCCDDETALAFHQGFKGAVIARITGPGACLTATFVRDTVARLRAERERQRARDN